MPKETCHFIIAEDVMGRLTDEASKRACQAHPDLVYLGSILHDAIYYYTGDNPHLHPLADTLHGADGEDSFSILHALAHAADSAQSEATRDLFIAFRVGVASHIFTDVHFHPLVYFFTGDYYSSNPNEQRRAQQLHRKFEAQLDWHLAGKELLSRRYKISAQLVTGRRALQTIFTGIEDSELLTHIGASELLSAYANYAIAQKLYQNRLVMGIAKRARFILPGELKKTLDDLHSLRFIRELEPDYQFLSSPIEFRHPVSNVLVNSDIATLRARATQATLSYLEEPSPNDSYTHGPSLETGIAEVGAGAMAYFDVGFIAKTAARL